MTLFITLLNIYGIGKSEQWDNRFPIPRIGESIVLHSVKYNVTGVSYHPAKGCMNVFILTETAK